MGMVEEYIEKSRIGQPTFLKLFDLDKEKQIQVIKSILSDHTDSVSLFNDNPRVTKTIVDDMPDTIKIAIYDAIIINSLGISFKPENGNVKRILSFDKFFTLGDLA